MWRLGLFLWLMCMWWCDVAIGSFVSLVCMWWCDLVIGSFCLVNMYVVV